MGVFVFFKWLVISPNISVCVVFQVQAVVTKAKSGDSLIRRKRHWLPPPVNLEENVDHTERISVARVID